MNTMNFQGGSTQNVFGQNYTNNLNPKNDFSVTKKDNNFSTASTSKPSDNSIKDYNNFLAEKEKEKDARDNRDTSKSIVNSRLENIKDKFEVYKTNNLAGEKDEIDNSLNLLKERINRKSNNVNNISNINNVSNTTNSVSNTNNTNPNNKINVVTPASNRDCGVFDSNFVLKTDKRSFLLNENNSNINSGKRKVSEDK